jgi:hypothetical protein
MQAHYAISGELVEGGQLMAAFVPQTLVGSGCYANCDGSTVAPLLNPGDFICFLNSFRAAQSLPAAQQQSSYANCDGSSVAPVLNPGDFTCFLSRFQGGCR